MSLLCRFLLRLVVVALSVMAGLASALLAVRAVSPLEIAPGVKEGTPVQALAFGAASVIVTFISVVLGLSKT